jgi:hypothetical protein
MLNKYGASGSYVKVGPAAYDPNTSTSIPSEVTTPVKVLIIEGIGRYFTQQQIENAGVTDLKACLVAGAALSADPAPGDKVLVGTTPYRAVLQRPFYSGDQVALWAIGVAR